MHRLTANEVPRIRPLFDTDHLRLVVDSISAGLTSAQVWADERQKPSVALVWEGHSIYIAGDPRDAVSRDKLRQLFATGIAPQGRTRQVQRFKLVYTPALWNGDIESIFGPLTAQNIPRCTYCAIGETPALDTAALEGGFALRQIDSALLNGALTHLDALKEEILGGWPSLAVFLERGFGFVILTQTAVISWCTAEYRSDGQCGIGIETVEGYGKRGFATAVASAFVLHARARDIHPYWDCWKNNIPSVRVAEKVGFTSPHFYEVAMGTFAPPAQIEFLYYFSNETFDLVEAKVLGLAADAPPAEIYHWLCYDRMTQRFEKLEFRAMSRDKDWNYREFAAAKLSYNTKQALLYWHAERDAAEIALSVGDPQVIPPQFVAEVEQFLGLRS